MSAPKTSGKDTKTQKSEKRKGHGNIKSFFAHEFKPAASPSSMPTGMPDGCDVPLSELNSTMEWVRHNEYWACYGLRIKNPEANGPLFWYGHVWDAEKGFWHKTGYLKNPEQANSSGVKAAFRRRNRELERDLRKGRLAGKGIDAEALSELKKWFTHTVERVEYWMFSQEAPLRTVASQAFREMTLSEIDRHLLSERAGKLMELMWKRIADQTEGAPAASISFDDWTDANGRHYTGVHGFVEVPGAKGAMPKYMSFTLANVPHEPGAAPDADFLARLIFKECQKQPWWRDGVCKFIVTDTTSVNPATVRKHAQLSGCNIRWIPCFAHVLNLMNGDVIASLKHVISPLLLACQLLRGSPDYEKICRGAAKQYWALPTYVEIRWWSLYKLLGRALEMRPQIEGALAVRRDEIQTFFDRRLRVWYSLDLEDVFASLSEEPETHAAAPPAEVGTVVHVARVLADGRVLDEKELARAASSAKELQKLPKLGERVWMAARLLQQSTGFFNDAQKEVEGEGFGQLSTVLRVYDELQYQINNLMAKVAGEPKAMAELKDMMAAGWAKASGHWQTNLKRSPLGKEDPVFGNVQNILTCAALFNPFTWGRWGSVFLKSTCGSLNDAEQCLRNIYTKLKEFAPEPVVQTQASRTGPIPTRAMSDADRLKMRALAEIGATEGDDADLPIESEIDQLKKIARAYDCSSLLRGDELLRFVHTKLKDLPVLYKLAIEILTAPSSSCSVERLFSRGPDILTKKRRRLADSTLQALMVLADNSEILGQILDVAEGINIERVRKVLQDLIADAEESLAA